MDFAAFCKSADDSFGPAVPRDCRGGFDFTLLFEHAILSVVPSVSFLLISTLRLTALYRARRVVRIDAAHSLKLAVATLYAALQLAALVLWSLPSTPRTTVSIPSAVISLISAIVIGVVSHYEHTRSVKPSTLLVTFLNLTAIFDVAVARTLWLSMAEKRLTAIFTAGVGVKVVLLLLEARGKTSLLLSEKSPSPESLSSIYSRSLFWWINPLFFRGLKNMLTLEDLDNLENAITSDHLAFKMSRAWKSSNQKGRWDLFQALCSAQKWHLLVPVPARLALTGFTYAQPFLITTAVNYVQGPVGKENDDVGYGLIGATIMVYLGISTSNALYNYKLYRAITMIRGSLVSIIYEKTLRMPSVSTKSSAALTLMSSDVDRISLTAETAYEIWSGILETAIALYLLEMQIGWACIAPVVLGVVALIGNTVISKLIPNRLKQWQQAVQKRVASTSTLLRNMRSVKMMGLSLEMADSLQEARVHELERSAHFRWFVAFMNLFGALPRLVSAPFTFLIFIFSTQFFEEGGISAARAFTTLSLLELMTAPLGKLLQALPVFTATIGCLDRIQDYLRLDEPTKTASLSSSQEDGSRSSQSTVSGSLAVSSEKKFVLQGPAIISDNITVKYKEDSLAVLKDISLTVQDSELVMVVGPVGCGKSTLLKTLVGDVEIASGSLHLKQGGIGYCQQVPWFTNSTVCKNIVGPTTGEYDQAWYKTVQSACALDLDVASWPDGDQTIIGTGGVTCSGGQKQRLALARAVYARKPLLVLDDVLNALDAETERSIFDSLFSGQGLMRRLQATVVLVTNNARHLPLADKIVILGPDGRICGQGSYDQLKHSESLAPILEVSAKTLAESEAHSPRADVKTAQKPTPQPKFTQSMAAQKEKARQTGDLRSYVIYGQSMGWTRAIMFLLIAITFAFCSKFSQVWLQWFTGSTFIDRALFIGVYFAFAVGTALLSICYFWWMMIVIIPISAGSLHQHLVTSVFRAPLRFFSTVDLGVILNRFSQDMQYATAQLPICTMNAVTTVFVCLVQFALIATGSGYLAAFIPLLLVAIWLLQKFYLRTSRQLRLLDLEQKSPLYTSLTETIEGLATIRAFNWSRVLQSIFLARLDNSQRPVYFLYCIQRWLNLVLDLIVAALAILLMVLATQLHGSNNGALLGLAMVSVIGFSQNLGQFIFFYTELETSLGAIARISEYTTELQPEDEPSQENRQSPPNEWPSQGHISFQHVTAHYDSANDPVLNNATIEFPAGHVVGIAGRTGSGKSSLLLTVLRLLSLSSGTITVDGIDISTVPGHVLRSKITTIPQDPFFPPKRTIRRSLNGNGGMQTDTELIHSLEKVGLLQHFLSHVGGLGHFTDSITDGSQLQSATVSKLLDANMEELPLSAGQLQLFCLAHALLQHHKRIVLLDEVTSALDYATEDKLRMILKEGLRGRTVLMIAHRPEMLTMCDMVVRLESGQVVKAQSIPESG